MITVNHLTKYYGDHLAVDDISFEITEGHVYGFLGPNGAGKSTTMNIMTGCLSATSGTVLIDGHDIFEEPNEAKRCIGYLPEHPPLYMNESALEYLRFVGEAKGLRGGQLRDQVEEVIEKTGIADVRHRRIGALSKGYKQRVGIAQALLGNPKVIILDEPTVGLDPIQIIEIRDLIKNLGKTHTVIFSSHILSEVQTICDRIVMIAKGKLVAFGEPEQLQKQLLTAGEIVLTTDAAVSQVKQALGELDRITDLEFVQGEAGLTVAHIKTSGSDMNEAARGISKCFAQNGLAIYELTQKKGSLEDVFLELSEPAEKEDDET
ncbi:MAG: ABC transporter ATP-binding protein [Faecousia sp.]